MFSFSGLTPEQVKELRSKYAVYIVGSGRINVAGMTPEKDPYCLALIKHYRSLVPMAQEHRKPIFNLTAADGAIGAHAGAVRDAGADFAALARTIAEKIGIEISS